MKITKRQLKRIIKEERAKLHEQDGMTRDQRDRIGQMRYDFEKAINSGMSLSNRFWYKDEATVLAVLEMLDELRAEIEEYSRM